MPPIEFSDDRPLAQGMQFQLLAITFCHRKTFLCPRYNRLIPQPLCQKGVLFSSQ